MLANVIQMKSEHLIHMKVKSERLRSKKKKAKSERLKSKMKRVEAKFECLKSKTKIEKAKSERLSRNDFRKKITYFFKT